MTRTFIALETNENLQRHLEGVIRQVVRVLPDARWVNPHGIHLTLAFLGELTDEQFARATHAAEAAARQVKPFTYRLSRLGIFGSPRHPRVLWIGINEPSGVLNFLHRVLNRELERHGFETDTRPFSPHLTLARVKAPLSLEEQQQLQEVLAGKQQGIVSKEEYSVRSVDVMKSELSRAGAKYTRLRECLLSGDDDG